MCTRILFFNQLCLWNNILGVWLNQEGHSWGECIHTMFCFLCCFFFAYVNEILAVWYWPLSRKKKCLNLMCGYFTWHPFCRDCCLLPHTNFLWLEVDSHWEGKLIYTSVLSIYFFNYQWHLQWNKKGELSPLAKHVAPIWNCTFFVLCNPSELFVCDKTVLSGTLEIRAGISSDRQML